MERNLLLLITLCIKIFGADFIYSAQISTQNHITTYQNIFISPAMTKNSYKNESFICSIEKNANISINTYDFLLLNKDKLFDCFASSNVKVYEDSIFYIQKQNTNTQLFFTPIKFRTKNAKNSVDIFRLY